MRLRCLLSASLLGLALAGAADEALIRPGVRLAVIETAHLRVHVPAEQAVALRAFAARADVVYTDLARQAGYQITRRLDLLVGDDVDAHNGYSFVVPFPLIQIELAPPAPGSGIFDGGDHLERTLIHELTHHIANDRNPPGFRRGAERIFGRVLPVDELSFLVFYLSTPAHHTMPAFWQEGLAQWAETTYAPPGAWRGRGRDSLTHMQWRLDADAGAIPPADDWRLTWHRWPHGNQAYLYGIAYLRWLDAAYGDRVTPWRMLDSQARQWAFSFDGGVAEVIGHQHADLLRTARAALLREQQANLLLLRARPVTTARRLTPIDTRVAAPAWLPDGRLLVAVDEPYRRPHYVALAAHGAQDGLWRSAWAMGGARSTPGGFAVYAETPGQTDPWQRSRIYLGNPAGQWVRVPGRRLVQPDVRAIGEPGSDGFHCQVAAIQVGEAGRCALVTSLVRVRSRLGFASAEGTPWSALPVEGRPWSPAFRPGHADLSWVETDAAGSRLVLAPIGEPKQRTVLAELPGRILHPAWSADGARVFLAADHSGVANAYVIEAVAPGMLRAVTNTIGGVLACVPSPDGRELAILDHDRDGPFIARLPADPAGWAVEAPRIELAWPAPVPRHAIRPLPRDADDQGAGAPPAAGQPVAPLPGARGTAAAPRPYHGVPRIRPLFWTPTLLPAPEGGYGVLGLAADPLLTHVLIAGAGVGAVEAEPVGMLAYACNAWPVGIAALAWQSERTFADQVVDTGGEEYDYTERVAGGELSVGYGLSGFRRRFQAYASFGLADYRVVDASADEFEGQTLINRPPFRGNEEYLEATLAYDDATFFPTSYAPEDGLEGSLTWRRSGFGGDLDREALHGRATAVFSVWPSQGHQLVLAGELGWSDGASTLQGAFVVGGDAALRLPRGNHEIIASGDHLLAGSVAYRLPLWRPFRAFGTSPLVFRQLVLEGFLDAARVSSDHPGGDGPLYRSAGGELHASLEFWHALLQPGLGAAQQLDGDEDFSVYASLGFRL